MTWSFTSVAAPVYGPDGLAPGAYGDILPPSAGPHLSMSKSALPGFISNVSELPSDKNVGDIVDQFGPWNARPSACSDRADGFCYRVPAPTYRTDGWATVHTGPMRRSWGDVTGDGAIDMVEAWWQRGLTGGSQSSSNTPCTAGLRLNKGLQHTLPYGQRARARFLSTWIAPDAENFCMMCVHALQPCTPSVAVVHWPHTRTRQHTSNCSRETAHSTPPTLTHPSLVPPHPRTPPHPCAYHAARPTHPCLHTPHRYAHPMLGDLNNDGYPDIVGLQVVDGNNTAQIGGIGVSLASLGIELRQPKLEVYLNDGSGNFPSRTASYDLGGTAFVYGLLLDADGDNDLDLLLQPSVTTHPFRLLANDGSGSFANHTHPSVGMEATSGRPLSSSVCAMPRSGEMEMRPGAITLADYDGDGDIDIVCAGGLWKNDGFGAFAEDTANPMTTDATGFVAVGDLDADGDVDIIVQKQGQMAVHLNDGTGTMINQQEHTLGVRTGGMGVAIADIDGDGDLDVWEGMQDDGRLWLNAGTGEFTEQDVQAGNGLNGYSRTRNSVWPSRFHTEDSSQDRYGNLFVDINGDGDLDMTNGGFLYENSRGGEFVDMSSQSEFLNFVTPTKVHAADIDGDGDVDLLFSVVGNYRWYQAPHGVNSGAVRDHYCPHLIGTTTSCWVPRFSVKPECGNATAFTNDASGYWRNCIDTSDAIDPVTGTTWAGASQAAPLASRPQIRNYVFVNDGKGVFSRAVDSAIETESMLTNTLSFGVGDIDGDGDTDILFQKMHFGFVGTGFGALHIYKNDGTGNFSDAQKGLSGSEELKLRTTKVRKIELGDVDGDGDLDLIIVGDPSSGGYEDFINGGCVNYDNVYRNMSSFFVGPVNGIPLGYQMERGIGGETPLNGMDVVSNLPDDDRPPNLPANCCRQSSNNNWGWDGMDQYNASCQAMTNPWPWNVPDCEIEFRRNEACCNNGRMYSIDWCNVCDYDPATSPNAANPTRMGTATVGSSSTTCSNGDRAGLPAWTQLFLNDGTGSFTWDETNMINFHSRSVVDVQLADLDNDGDLDAVFAASNQPNLVFENDGSGQFTEVPNALRPARTTVSPADSSSSPAPEKDSYQVILVDVDADGDVDILFPNQNDDALLYINQGGGGGGHSLTNLTFLETSEIGQYGLAPRSASTVQMPRTWGESSRSNWDQRLNYQEQVAVGDLDGDGDMDVLFASRDSTRIYAQVAQGDTSQTKAGFQELDSNTGGGDNYKAPFTEGGTETIAIFDADGDGDMDIFAARSVSSNSNPHTAVHAGTNHLYIFRHCPTSAYHPDWGCVQCPTNSIRDATNDFCFECPAHTQPSAGQCSACTAGNDRAIGALACGQCMPGTSTLGSGAPCAPCSPGSAASGSGNLLCATCGGGYFASGHGSTNCTEAPPGYYASEGATVALPCAPGRFGSSPARPDGQCTGACQPGHFCPAGSTNATANKCPSGTYNPVMGSSTAAACLNCPPGSFCTEAATATELCPAGRYGSATSLSSADCSGTCAPGYYCPEGSVSANAFAVCIMGSLTEPAPRSLAFSLRAETRGCSSSLAGVYMFESHFCSAHRAHILARGVRRASTIARYVRLDRSARRGRLGHSFVSEGALVVRLACQMASAQAHARAATSARPALRTQLRTSAPPARTMRRRARAPSQSALFARLALTARSPPWRPSHARMSSSSRRHSPRARVTCQTARAQSGFTWTPTIRAALAPSARRAASARRSHPSPLLRVASVYRPPRRMSAAVRTPTNLARAVSAAVSTATMWP